MIIKKNWILTLGILAMMPGMTMAGPFAKKAPTTPVATSMDAARGAKTNDQIAQEIANALRGAKLTGYDIEIEYQNGKATITGMVADPRQKAIADNVIRSVREVKMVDNKLGLIANGAPVQQASHEAPQGGVQKADYQAKNSNIASPIQLVDFSTTAPDLPAANNQQVAESIAAALQQSGINGYDIEVRYENGVASLAGNVGTPEQRFLAERAVSSIQGVQKVDNRLTFAQPQGGMPQGGMPTRPASYSNEAAMPMMAGAGGGAYGAPMPANGVYNQPSLPNHSFPTYAQYPNAAAVTYPKQYSASAFPYVGPFYPYPQVPRGWRRATLEWDDGNWQLEFDNKTDRWWWFVNPKNW
jgi:osmotically-inducible protein OsmY